MEELTKNQFIPAESTVFFLHTCISHLFEFSDRNEYQIVGSTLPPVETVRTFFPETWIWQLTEVGYVNAIKTTYSRTHNRLCKWHTMR